MAQRNGRHRATRELAEAIRESGHRVHDRRSNAVRHAQVVGGQEGDKGPLKLRIFGTDITLNESDGDLVLGESVRSYSDERGFSSEDAVAVVKMEDGDWLAFEVIASGPDVAREVVGRVNADGTRAAGTGFSSSRSAAGTYQITFSPSFDATPSIQGTAHHAPFVAWAPSVAVHNPSPSTTTIYIAKADADGNAGILVDSSFEFTARDPG